MKRNSERRNQIKFKTKCYMHIQKIGFYKYSNTNTIAHFYSFQTFFLNSLTFSLATI